MKGSSCFLGCAASAAAMLLGGCSPSATPPKIPVVKEAGDDHGHAHAADDHHDHAAGPHDGTLADWGGGAYHVEFTVDHDANEAVVYVLGADEKTPAPVKATGGTLLLTIVEPACQVELGARPLEGEGGGKSSCYAGKHETLGTVREFAGTISAEVEGTPFAGDFAEEAHTDHEH